MARKVRLAIDALGARHGGAAKVALATTHAAIRSPAVHSVVLAVSPQGERRFSLPVSDKLSAIEVETGQKGLARLQWQANGFRQLCQRAGVSHALLLGNGGMADGNVVRGMLVQQSLPFVPEGLNRLGLGERARMAAISGMIRWSASSADVVLVQTETMRDLLCLELSCEKGRLKVIPVGAPSQGPFCPREKRPGAGAERPLRALYVGNSSKYKNLDVLPPALEILSRSRYGAVLTATVTPGTLLGGRDWVREIGYVDGERVAAEYGEADCLVMPSVSETVCLPLIEAMNSGLPVVVADRPYAREVCGPAAVFFDPTSPEDLARAVVEATADNAERESRMEEGRRRAAKWVSPAAYDDLIRAVLEAG